MMRMVMIHNEFLEYEGYIANITIEPELGSYTVETGNTVRCIRLIPEDTTITIAVIEITTTAAADSIRLQVINLF
jgi:hypothetical protein